MQTTSDATPNGVPALQKGDPLPDNVTSRAIFLDASARGQGASHKSDGKSINSDRCCWFSSRR
ncbi:hypothetical protein L798_03422 [Zootermopsis nevadensis]|uniref:Uncharacterized protein n=1 Tax=Zootermopsis nevadensis TaxID=136037 RepID=A0A067QIL2_ZOONE|nr:hypothetical protein L798_03422 [Zootermopsis nevadensis]